VSADHSPTGLQSVALGKTVIVMIGAGDQPIKTLMRGLANPTEKERSVKVVKLNVHYHPRK
jgi:hypothetical protein